MQGMKKFFLSANMSLGLKIICKILTMTTQYKAKLVPITTYTKQMNILGILFH